MENMIDSIKKLEVKKGDVLVLRLNDSVPIRSFQQMAESVKQIPRVIGVECSVLLLPYEFGEIGPLSEKTMNDFGWYRK